VGNTINIDAGATASGSTKTLNIGTGGLAGSTTAITIGSTTGTSTNTLNGITNGAFNGTVGATTPSTVAATTGTFSGQITSTIDGAKYLSRTGTSINQQFQEVGNTGGNYQLGVERSTGGALVVGGSPYATVLTTTGATNIEFGVNLQKVGTFTSTGLNSTAIGATTPSTGAFTTLTSSFLAASGPLASFSVAQGLYGYYNSGGVIGAYSNNTGTLASLTLNGSSIAIQPAGSTVGLFTTTGLAVTGALSATGALSIGNTVNTVSPTSPNRTVTIVIGGTTYYLAAKTTND
jgi:hypothetical protein